VALAGLDGLLGGTVREWRDPWFVIDCDDGSHRHAHPRGLLDCVLFAPSDFCDPTYFEYDWTRTNPMRIAGWRVGLAAAIDEAGLVLPKPWLQRVVDGGPAVAAAPAGREAERQAEQVHLDTVLAHLSGEMRAERTHANLNNPALKLIWWLASRGHDLNSPTPHALASYLAFLFDDRGNLGALQQAREALGLLGRLNAWPAGLKEGVASVPIDAARRLFRHQVRKVLGLKREHVEGIFDAYVWVRPGVPLEGQWEHAVGLAIVTGYKVWARYNDLSQMRFEDGFCDVCPTHIDFRIPRRKNKQFHGDTVTVARPADPAVRGAYHALLEAKARIRKGFILPHVDARGLIGRSRPMPYGQFVQHLRQALRHVGVSEADSLEYAAHSMRSGAATEAAPKLPPHLICLAAGVDDLNWILGYHRASLDDRLRSSLATGL
jgi:hypothetical protein